VKITEVGAAAIISEAFPIRSLADQRKLLQNIEALIERGKVDLIFNMDKIEYMMTVELGSLVAAMKKARAKGGTVKLVAVGEFLDSLLSLTNLKGAFGIYPTEAEALKSL
jgi:anti-anti-sigma factor